MHQFVGRYYYDGEGRRVKKEVPATGETTIFVYDAFGKLTAEYSTQVAPSSEAKVSYLTSDHLGSPRVLTEQSGKVYSRRDFMPFGEEIRTPQRTEQLGYGGDTVRQKFTGYERDVESGLDFTQARMFAYNHGRFTSPDPLAASANPFHPQSWNRYSYSYNNPLRFTDPNGMIPGDYYNQDGEYIGWDGVEDGKLYVVTDEKEVEQIRKTEKKGGTTPTSAISSEIELPSLLVRQAVGAAVERSNKPTADDKQGGFHEEGFIAGPSLDGWQEKIVVAASGPYSDPRTADEASIDTTIPANPKEEGILANITVMVHVHPKGEIVTGSNSSLGTVTIGGSQKVISFRQEPSAIDLKIAAALPNTMHIVVGARNKTVYIYDGTGIRATFPLEKFITITARRRR
ncbi:MAG: RHS repeat-associated core domain-containing protein [Acidobacteria bacterium]|jgi:RHS repeat-associated protein|nr:MAG: RHS repeat-associated core domain-containing protein [Acidobacteriota bacterium]GIU81251.1 MAG: hypothetical protein KatS3mg006_0315 [Pyrinomonadaceae bacterium]